MRCRFLTLLVAPAASLRPEASLRRGIVWDVDGTLVDSTRLGFDASNEVLARNGYAAISADEYAVGAKFSTPDRFSWHVGAAAGSDAGAALGAAFDDCYVARVNAETAGAFDGVDRLLRRLRCPQGALSNANGAYVRAVLAANGLDGGLFGVAWGADDVPAPKPDAAGALACCAALGLDPARSVFVGDSPSDAGAAKAAGMRSVGCLYGANEAALRAGAGFDRVVEDVAGLAAALRDLGFLDVVDEVLAPGSSWTVRKDLAYERGGVSSTFEGVATLTAFDDGARAGVLCSEAGTLALPGGDVESRSHTLFCYDGDRLELRFVDDPAVAASRPFAASATWSDATTCADLVHPCGPDVYEGTVDFGDGAAWRQVWRVDGPRKRGVVTTTYERKTP